MIALLATRLAEHFESLPKQAHAARLAMWTFIASELMLFAALFALYASFATAHGAAFREGVRLNHLALGTTNTVILVTSSFTVALAVHAARVGRARRTAALLGATVALGAVFLAIKGYEYASHFEHGLVPGAVRGGSHALRVFFALYFCTTGLHGLHVIAGMAVLSWLAWGAARRAFRPEAHVPLELGGLYWHLVDIIWLFLWPMFYLFR